MKLAGVDTNLIVALRALLVHRNVTRAGKEVGLSQSSMSHALSRLRAHFEDPLLVPVGRELMLSERARGLLGPVTTAISELETVFARPKAFEPSQSDRVFRIAATDNLELYVLPRLAALLHETAPQVSVRVAALPQDWQAGLQRGDIDLKLGRKYAVPNTLVSQDLSSESFTTVVRRKHPTRAKLTLQQFAALNHLLVAPNAPLSAEPEGAVDKLLRRHGLRRRVAMVVPSFLVAPFIVASSDLVLTAPTRMLAPVISSLGLRALELTFSLPSYKLSQVWAATVEHDDGHRWLRSTILGIFSR